MSNTLEAINPFQAGTLRAFNDNALPSYLYPFAKNKFSESGSIRAILPAGMLFPKPSFCTYHFGDYTYHFGDYDKWKNFNDVSRVAAESVWKGGVSSAGPTSSPKVTKVSGGVIETNTENVGLGPLALNAADYIADISAALRGVHGWMKMANCKDDTIALSALGVTSGINILTGPFGFYDGWKDWKTTEKVQDRWGQFLAAQKMARAVVQTGSGVVYLPFRALTIAAVATGSKVIGSIANIFGHVGVGVSILFAILGSFGNACKVYEYRSFAANLRKMLGDASIPEDQRYQRCLQDLQSQLTLFSNEKAEIRKAVENDPKLTKDERESLIQQNEEKAVRKKELQMVRVTDRSCVEKVKSAKIDEAKAVVDQVNKANNRKTIIAGISIALAILTIVGTIAALVFTGGSALIISSVIGSIASVGFLMVDGYQLLQDFKTGESGRYDRLWIYISMALCLVAVTVALLLSSELLVIIVAGSIGLIWLSINVATFIRLRRSRKAESVSTK